MLEHILYEKLLAIIFTQFKDVVALQKIFNHKDQKETLIYIGIQQDELDSKMIKFNL